MVWPFLFQCVPGMGVLDTVFARLERVKRRRCEQDEKGAALPTEVYIDVRAQGKT